MTYKMKNKIILYVIFFKRDIIRNIPDYIITSQQP